MGKVAGFRTRAWTCACQPPCRRVRQYTLTGSTMKTSARIPIPTTVSASIWAASSLEMTSPQRMTKQSSICGGTKVMWHLMRPTTSEWRRHSL
ncbi:unnamed protein product [Ectocarpus sp. 12 AP-2014]